MNNFELNTQVTFQCLSLRFTSDTQIQISPQNMIYIWKLLNKTIYNPEPILMSCPESFMLKVKSVNSSHVQIGAIVVPSGETYVQKDLLETNKSVLSFIRSLSAFFFLIVVTFNHILVGKSFVNTPPVQLLR